MQFQRDRRFLMLKAPRNGVRRLELEGVSYDEDQVRFDVRLYDEQLASIAAAALMGAMVPVPGMELRSRRKRYEPGSQELELINEMHRQRQQAYTADELFIFERYPANNITSRSIRLRFTDRALAKMAQDATAGRSRIMHHNDHQVVGRTIFGEVVEEDVRGFAGKYLRTIEYIPRTDGKAEVISDIEAGILSYDSVGVYLGSAVEFKDVEVGGVSLSVIEVDYDPGDTSPLEMHEISFVYLGELNGVGSKQGDPARQSAGADGVPSPAATLTDRARATLAGNARDGVPAGDSRGTPAPSSKPEIQEILWLRS